MSRPFAVLVLLLCTTLWGFTFVAQKSITDDMGPLTFAAARYLLGGAIVLPLGIWEYRRRHATGVHLTRQHWLLIAGVSLVLFVGSWLQQAGLATTTVTNGGFLTSLYVLLVPVIAFVALRTKPHPVIYAGVALALIGVFLLNGGRLDAFNAGDLLVIACALAFAFHVLLLGAAMRGTGMPIFVSAVSFLVTGVLSSGFGLWLESPTLANLEAGWMQLAYAGVLSTAVAFTLQAVGQQYLPPANAAIILSSEGLFAALGGALLLGERLPLEGYIGAALIFAAILLVEVVPALRRPAATPG